MKASTRSAAIDAVVFFGWWQALARRTATLPLRIQWMSLAALAVVGLALRLLAQQAPATFDLESYLIVSSSVLEGSNPYQTGRYNYGPPWFVALAAIRWVMPDPESFRVGLTIVLWIADLAIAAILVRRGWLIAGLLMMVIPTAVAISGQHHQFDNVAIAIGLAAAALVPRDVAGKLTRTDVLAVVLLGLSISVKHVFVVLPLWLALRQQSWSRRIAYAVAPIGIFGLSLLPFWIADRGSISTFVFGYRSYNNAPVYYWALPDELVWGAVNRGWITLLFLAVVASLGLLYRRLAPLEMTLAYLVAFTLFSSAIIDQYLAIPTPATLVFLNVGFLAWLALASVYLLGEPTDLNLPLFNDLKLHLAPRPDMFYNDMVVPLAVGWVVMTIWLVRRSIDPRRRLSAS